MLKGETNTKLENLIDAFGVAILSFFSLNFT